MRATSILTILYKQYNQIFKSVLRGDNPPFETPFLSNKISFFFIKIYIYLMCNCGPEFSKKLAAIKDVKSYNKGVIARNKARGIPISGRMTNESKNIIKIQGTQK